MKEQFCRTTQLLGNENVEKLFDRHVIVFGVGGVGGYVVEALARSGVGKISIVDKNFIHTTSRKIIRAENLLLHRISRQNP